jgi:hypothetical protein
VIMKYNHPEDEFKCYFKTAVERPDPTQWLEAAKVFYDMGGKVKSDEVRSVMGFSRPAEGDDVLSKEASIAAGLDTKPGGQEININRDKPQPDIDESSEGLDD